MARNVFGCAYEKSGETGRPRKAVVDGKQQCCICKQWKLLDEFCRSKVTANGYDARCKPCNTRRGREQRKGKQYTIRVALWHLANSHKKAGMFGQRGQNRRRKMIEESEVNVDLLQAIYERQEGKCAVTGIELTWIRGYGRGILTNMSIDRINPADGYKASNIRLVCKIVNYMKHNLSDAEMFEWAARILNGPLNQNTNQDFNSEAVEG